MWLPANQSNNVLALLGSLWSRTHPGRHVLLRIVQANLELQLQQRQDLEETVSCLSRYDIPVYHTENWIPVRICSEVGTTGCVCTLPEGVVEVPILQNRIASPSVVLFDGLDYSVRAGMLVFKRSPFSDAAIPQSSEIRPGAAAIREITLWAYKAKIDRKHVLQQFGAIAELPQPRNIPAETYKQLVNAVIDVMTRGTSTAAVKAAVALLHGVPVTTSPVEVVQDVCEAHTGPLVLTDVNVYRLPSWASAAVCKGQRLPRGTPLVDACVIVDPHRCDSIDIKEIAVPASMLPSGIHTPLTFVNNDVPLQRSPLRFSLGGRDSAKNCFWKQTDVEVLEKLLTDVNGNLPMTINPMKFLMRHILSGNCMVILKRPQCPRPIVPMDAFLRKIVPPPIAVLTATLPEN